MGFISDEELHETLLSLEGIKNREKKLQLELDLFLDGLKVLTMSVNPSETFITLIEKLRELIQIEEAFILSEKENVFIPTTYTNEIFKNTVWKKSDLINRIIKGEYIICHDISKISDWLGQPEEIKTKVSSVIYSPLVTSEMIAIFVGTSSKAAFFTRSHREIISRFSLLMTQALINAENRALRIKKQEELSQSLISLQEKTDELKKTRDALWGEMQLAKKIQSVLIPKNPKIHGYEISAFIAPTNEVGGDYYDIINIDGKEWITIGDVSGHGVPAGLVMMMTHTAIRVALAQQPDIAPSKLLTIINKILTENIHMFGDDKYVTISVIAVHDNGKFYFSGLHQDIMIFRKKTSMVDIIQSRGMWIGLKDDIKDMVYDDILSLDIEDVILFYTDGITEAWVKNSIKNNRNPEDAMFGAKNLKNILQESGKLSCDQIKDNILKELENYICNDDITLLVLKRIE